MKDKNDTFQELMYQSLSNLRDKFNGEILNLIKIYQQKMNQQLVEFDNCLKVLKQGGKDVNSQIVERCVSKRPDDFIDIPELVRCEFEKLKNEIQFNDSIKRVSSKINNALSSKLNNMKRDYKLILNDYFEYFTIVLLLNYVLKICSMLLILLVLLIFRTGIFKKR